MAILSRYQSLPTFEDDQGNTYSTRYKRAAKNFQYFEVVLSKPATLDLISQQQYGTPLLYWAIADLNDILNPMVLLPAGMKIKVPQI